MSLLVPYCGTLDGSARRQHDSCYGMDPTLRIIITIQQSEQLTPDQELLLRQAAMRYSTALRRVRDHAAVGDYPACVSTAKIALAHMPKTQPHASARASARMCGWMTADYFADLARIIDLDTADTSSDAASRSRTMRNLVNEVVARNFPQMRLHPS